MIVYIFNGLALLMVFAAVLLAIALGIASDKFDVTLPLMFAPGLSWITWDLIVRVRAGRRLFHPDAGGHLYFIPMWILGFGLIVGSFAAKRVIDKEVVERVAKEKVKQAQFEERVRAARERAAALPADPSLESSATDPSTEPTSRPATAP